MCEMCEEYGWNTEECPEMLAEESVKKMEELGMFIRDQWFDPSLTRRTSDEL